MQELVMEPWHYWLITGIILATLEILIPGFVIFAFGFGAIVASIVHYFSHELSWAIAGFSAGSLFFFFFIRPFALRFLHKGEGEQAQFGGSALIGETITILDAPDVGGAYQTKFNDSIWRVKSEDDLMEGDLAKIVAVDSATLIVVKAQPEGEV